MSRHNIQFDPLIIDRQIANLNAFGRAFVAKAKLYEEGDTLSFASRETPTSSSGDDIQVTFDC